MSVATGFSKSESVVDVKYEGVLKGGCERERERRNLLFLIWPAVKRRSGKSFIRNGILHFEGEQGRKKWSRDQAHSSIIP